jgi:CRISPR type III-B/RAMP module RAMP protein Cmr6
VGGFEKLERIVVLDVTYETVSNMSINTGKGDGIRDNLVIREAGPESNSVISGSGVKGVVRSTIEALLTQTYKDTKDEDCKVCVPATCLEDDRTLPPDRLDSRDCNEDPCFVCQIFGNTKQKGRVIFHDAKAMKTVTTIDRSHNAIARGSGRVGGADKGGPIRNIEAVPSNEAFRGSIVLVNPDEWMVGAIYDTLYLIQNLGIGSKTTAGYGQLKVHVEPYFDVKPKGEAADFIKEYIETCKEIWRKRLSIEYKKPEEYENVPSD